MKSRKLSRKSKLKPDQSFFQVMIEAVQPERSFFQVFWSVATHPGAAVESVLNACVGLGITNAIARELDDFEFNSLPKNAIRVKSSSVWYAPGRAYFPTEKSFIAPFGIIESTQKGELDYELIQEGFSLAKTDAGIYEVEAAIESDKLFSTFVELMNRLPTIRVFWIKLAADWEDQGREDFWTNESLNTSKSITTFLTTHSKDTVANGHVALTAYSNVGQTNLSIDTHKTIKVLTKSAKIQRKMAASLKSLEFKELSEFHSLEYGYYHWHYRPARSKSRTRLVAALRKSGFTLWKSEPLSDMPETLRTG
jgi:hypothetical protein